MDRREFFQKIGISAEVLASMNSEILQKTVAITEEDRLKLDQNNLDFAFIELEVSAKIYKIPIYTME